jgi:hypothetical protein
MKKFLHEQPLHSFFIGLYFISFVFVRNLAVVELSMVWRSVFFDIILSVIIFGLMYLVFRSSRKAGIYTTLLLLGFFTYGALYNVIEKLYYQGHWPFSHIHRFLLFMYAAGYFSLLAIFLRTRRPHHMVNYILNIFVLIIFLINATVILSYYADSKNWRSNSNAFVNKDLPDSIKGIDIKPDVYYIILDGYASETTIKNFYNQQEPRLYQYLRTKNFYICDSSTCNYPATLYSLSSSLNYNYLDSLKGYMFIQQNLVNQVFKKAGYRVVNIESGYSVTENIANTDKSIPIRSANEFENRLFEVTILRLDDLLGFTNYSRIKSELERLPRVAKEPGPKFSFIHIVSPHPPFVLDADGNRVVRSSFSDNSWEPRQFYYAQLEYVSKKIIDFVDELLKKPGIHPIIIIQSDHGPWIMDKNPVNVYNARTGILNAFFAPSAITEKLYPTITPVNSFRVIFSGLTNTRFPLLKDIPYPYDSLVKNVTFQSYVQ